MDPLTIALIAAVVLGLIAAASLGAHFAPGRAKAAAAVEAAEVKGFQAVIGETMLAWQSEQTKQAQAIAVQTAALAADKAAFAATQAAIAAMTAGAANAPAQS